MKKTKVSFLQIILYGVATFVGNFLSFYPLAIILKIILKLFGYNLFTIIVSFAAYLLIPLGVCCLFVYFTMKFTNVSCHYEPNDSKFYWLKYGATLVLPSEVARFLISLFTLGNFNEIGWFSAFPTLIFEETYLRFTGRLESVRWEMSYIPLDFLVYSVCYLIYAAIHLLAIFAIYRIFWNKGKRDRDDLIVHETKWRRKFY